MTSESMLNPDEPVDGPTLDTAPEELTDDPLLNEEHMTAEQAAEYVGISASDFAAIAKRFGIGHHYDPTVDGQIVWAISDVERVKQAHSEAA